jgi:hypothetical protein
MPHTVGNKGGCAVDAAAYAAREIAAHFIFVLARLKDIPRGRLGKSESYTDQENRRNAQPAPVFKKGVVPAAPANSA